MRGLAGIPASVMFLIVAFGTISDVWAQCPLNVGQINPLGCPFQESTAPVFSFYLYCVTGYGSESYDLTNGTIGVTAFEGGDSSMEVFMQTTDDFVINGPAGGSPIVFSAILQAKVNASSELKLFSGAVRDSTDYAGALDQTLRLTLQHSVGEHFLVSMRAFTVSVRLQGTSASGVLGFTALPPGYSLSSCQGYAAAPVPTRPTSWGRLKQFFR